MSCPWPSEVKWGFPKIRIFRVYGDILGFRIFRVYADILGFRV